MSAMAPPACSDAADTVGIARGKAAAPSAKLNIGARIRSAEQRFINRVPAIVIGDSVVEGEAMLKAKTSGP